MSARTQAPQADCCGVIFGKVNALCPRDVFVIVAQYNISLQYNNAHRFGNNIVWRRRPRTYFRTASAYTHFTVVTYRRRVSCLRHIWRKFLDVENLPRFYYIYLPTYTIHPTRVVSRKAFRHECVLNDLLIYHIVVLHPVTSSTIRTVPVRVLCSARSSLRASPIFVVAFAVVDRTTAANDDRVRRFFVV